MKIPELVEKLEYAARWVESRQERGSGQDVAKAEEALEAARKALMRGIQLHVRRMRYHEGRKYR